MAIRRGLVSCGTSILISLAATFSGSTLTADDYAEVLSTLPDAEQLRAWHDLLGSEPHVAGTVGDRREIARLRDAFKAMGLKTEVHEFLALLPKPIEARLVRDQAVPHAIWDFAPHRTKVIRIGRVAEVEVELPSV